MFSRTSAILLALIMQENHVIILENKLGCYEGYYHWNNSPNDNLELIKRREEKSSYFNENTIFDTINERQDELSSDGNRVIYEKNNLDASEFQIYPWDILR